MNGPVPPLINTLYVSYWPESSIVLLGVGEVAVGAGLTVNADEAELVCVSDVVALSATSSSYS